jgi:hypothetical protein
LNSLTNQPVVLDNVSFAAPRADRKLTRTGLRNDKGWIRRRRTTIMLYSIIVNYLIRPTGTGESLHLSVGRPKHPRVMAGAIQDNLFIGRRAQELRGLLKIKYPMEHGIVMDWDDMERIWGWVYSDGLKALSEEVRFLALTSSGSTVSKLTCSASRASDRSSPESSPK